MPIERPCVAFYVLAIVISNPSVSVCEKFFVKMCMTSTMILQWQRSNVNMPIKMSNAISYVELALFVLSVIIFKIIT